VSTPGRVRRLAVDAGVPAGLLVLILLPSSAGVLRLADLGGVAHLLPDSPRMAALPVPVALHIVAAIAYAAVGAFQFVGRFRRRHPRWHRLAGRGLVGLGLAVAGSAAWMALAYDRQPGSGELAFVLRLVFAVAMAGSLVLGVAAIRRGNVAGHRAWMIRAYAIAVSAGTQVITLAVAPLFGSGTLNYDLGLAAGWFVNLVVAQLILHSTSTPAAPDAHAPESRGDATRRSPGARGVPGLSVEFPGHCLRAPVRTADR
jgi:uncharacterized membrane protein